MKKQTNFPDMENTQLDEKIRKIMQRSFPLPENVEASKAQAFEEIRRSQAEEKSAASPDTKGEKRHKSRRLFYRTCAATAAAAAVFCGVCITNPAFASQIPLVGHVFEEIGESLGFSGDFGKYATPLEEPGGEDKASQAYTDDASSEEAPGKNTEVKKDSPDTLLYSETQNGMTVTLSEVYCNDAALYVSMVIHTEEKFPDTAVINETTPVLNANDFLLKFSYEDRERTLGEYLEGKMVDDHTYAGVLRCNLASFGSEEAEIPEKFSVDLLIPRIIGSKPDGKIPEMPSDLREEYEQALEDNGLSPKAEDYEFFTEEQKELEHQLFVKMWNAYGERYPETREHPNSYEDWWVDGPWKFSFEVTKDSSQTVVKEMNDVNEENIGLVSVTKTPFELIVEDSNNPDSFTVVLDADGDIMPSGTFGGWTNVMPLQDRDVSKIDIYICDYIEYMDELKGYYWSEDYQENKKTKTFKQLLDERALYHKELIFEE